MRMAAYLAAGAGADFAPTSSPACLRRLCFLPAQEAKGRTRPRRGFLQAAPPWESSLLTLLDGPATRLARVQATLALPKPAAEAGSLKFATAVGASFARPRATAGRPYRRTIGFPSVGACFARPRATAGRPYRRTIGFPPVGASFARPRNDHRSFPTSGFGAFPGGRPQVAPTDVPSGFLP